MWIWSGTGIQTNTHHVHIRTTVQTNTHHRPMHACTGIRTRTMHTNQSHTRHAHHPLDKRVPGTTVCADTGVPGMNPHTVFTLTVARPPRAMGAYQSTILNELIARRIHRVFCMSTDPLQTSVISQQASFPNKHHSLRLIEMKN